MGRSPRLVEPHAIYHVISRGSDEGIVFADDDDRAHFLELFARIARRYAWKCLTYSVLSTHYHLLVQVGEAGLSDGMQILNGGFSRQANRRQGRRAHRFENRFFSDEIATDARLLNVARYVDLNTVMAGMCDAPDEWPWSGYRASVGLEAPRSFHVVDTTLGLFHVRKDRAVEAYRRFVQDGLAVARATRLVSDTDTGLCRIGENGEVSRNET